MDGRGRIIRLAKWLRQKFTSSKSRNDSSKVQPPVKENTNLEDTEFVQEIDNISQQSPSTVSSPIGLPPIGSSSELSSTGLSSTESLSIRLPSGRSLSIIESPLLSGFQSTSGSLSIQLPSMNVSPCQSSEGKALIQSDFEKMTEKGSLCNYFVPTPESFEENSAGAASEKTIPLITREINESALVSNYPKYYNKATSFYKQTRQYIIRQLRNFQPQNRPKISETADSLVQPTTSALPALKPPTPLPQPPPTTLLSDEPQPPPTLPSTSSKQTLKSSVTTPLTYHSRSHASSIPPYQTSTGSVFMSPATQKSLPPSKVPVCSTTWFPPTMPATSSKQTQSLPALIPSSTSPLLSKTYHSKPHIRSFPSKKYCHEKTCSGSVFFSPALSQAQKSLPPSQVPVHSTQMLQDEPQPPPAMSAKSNKAILNLNAPKYTSLKAYHSKPKSKNSTDLILGKSLPPLQVPVDSTTQMLPNEAKLPPTVPATSGEINLPAPKSTFSCSKSVFTPPALFFPSPKLLPFSQAPDSSTTQVPPDEPHPPPRIVSTRNISTPKSLNIFSKAYLSKLYTRSIPPKLDYLQTNSASVSTITSQTDKESPPTKQLPTPVIPSANLPATKSTLSNPVKHHSQTITYSAMPQKHGTITYFSHRAITSPPNNSAQRAKVASKLKTWYSRIKSSKKSKITRIYVT